MPKDDDEADGRPRKAISRAGERKLDINPGVGLPVASARRHGCQATRAWPIQRQ